MKIDINKKYRYRNGKPARILCVDGPCIHRGEPQPVMSMDAGGEVNAHFPSGRFVSALNDSDLDLIEIREPREWWLNIYPNLGYAAHLTPEAAEAGRAGVESVETIRVREIID